MILLPKANPILLTDSYKVSHWKQYPEDTTGIFSFFESRGGLFPNITFFGLQYYLKRYLCGRIVTYDDIAEAREFFGRHFGQEIMNEAGWRRIVEIHGGRLPVKIRAVPEGTTVPVSNVLMTIENTDPKIPWITNYLETILSEIWYPSTVCTMSRGMKSIILEALRKTGDPASADFKLHDFGFRGSTSIESAGIGGTAHLVNFKGTDTMAALAVARQYYGEPMAGFSIPAAEHSTVTAWGREREADAYQHILEAFPTGPVAIVSDSYDIFHACRKIWGEKLKKLVLNRDGSTIIRPDSGYPPRVVVDVLNILGRVLGSSLNNRGFKVLSPKVRLIQGDGIDLEMVKKVLEEMAAAGWSADNIAFGSGGGLLQKMDRDTQRFAFKCSAICSRNKGWRGVMKDPATDRDKRSKAGRLALIQRDGRYLTVREGESTEPNLLVPVFQDGKLLVDQSLAEIRARANLG